MSDTLHDQSRVKLTGWLERADAGGVMRLWRLPLMERLWFLAPVDVLFVGDRLHFPDTQDERDLLLRVVFTAGRAAVAYVLPGAVACRCGCSALHQVTIADVGRHRPGADAWTFVRKCRSCRTDWFQDGQKHEEVA